MDEQSPRAVATQRAARHIVAFVRQAPDLAALIAMALIGLGISIYLTTVHYASALLVCSTTGPIDCAAVTQSAYSVVPGTQIPVTIPGMLWFLVSAGLALLAWRARGREDDVPWRVWLVQVLWGAGGAVTVLYLVYAELVKLHKICEWCTGVHVLTVLSFFVILARPVPVASMDDVEEEE